MVTRIRIRVIEAQKEILPGWDALIIEMVKGKLENNKNLEILKGKPIIEISPHSVTLSSGETLQTNVTVWTAGIGGQDLTIIPEAKRIASGRIIVNRVLPGPTIRWRSIRYCICYWRYLCLSAR